MFTEHKLSSFRPLEEHLIESDLGPSVEVLRTWSRGILSAREFLEQRHSFGPGYLLGIDGPTQTSQMFSGPYGLKHWPQGYSEFRIYPKAVDRTPAYMAKLIASGKPIVFFVPAGLMKRKSITQEEMLWLLENPSERLKNVTFVFGMYEVLPTSLLQEYSFHRDHRLIESYLHRLLQR